MTILGKQRKDRFRTQALHHGVDGHIVRVAQVCSVVNSFGVQVCVCDSVSERVCERMCARV